MLDMWEFAADRGLSVVEARGPHRSGYYPGERVIRLTPGMRGRVLRSVLAHEVGHHELGHRPLAPGIERDRQEAAANRWAASLLISPLEYAAAERLRGGHLPSIAVDLQVSDELVSVYRAQLFRAETTVYVGPRMGLGQWDYRQEVA